MRQRRCDDRLDLSPVVEAAFGGEELERRPGLFPGRLGGRGLIPEPLGLTPEPAQRRAIALTRSALAGTIVESLLSRVGVLQGAGGRAPGPPQGTSPFAERMEDVECLVEVGQTCGATAGALE